MRKHHAAAGGVVLCLHLAFFLIILLGLRQDRVPQQPYELQMMLFKSPQPRAHLPTKPDLADMPVLQPPDIVVESAPAAAAPAAVAQAMVLAPRPDPAHANPPLAGSEFSGLSGTLHAILKILVMPDGSISDAKVIQSCGQPQADAAAIAFIKANWKLLPALAGTDPIQYWTTITVQIGSA